ncbi:hypothetical protein H6G27_35500 [Nostoc linckia FACHB-104]|nr:hypothetical protein [Nostoc linckia FACHB-104]
MNETSPSSQRDIVPRRLDLVPRYRRQLEKEFRTQHQRFSLTTPPYPTWKSYANQMHIRDMIFDRKRGEIWLATWGGVLCWHPETDICIRHTSEHGLLGNATRHIVLDDQDVVWASGQEKGFSYFKLGSDTPWQSHRDFERWKILQVFARPDSGVYVALQDASNKCALGEITDPDSRLRLLVRDVLGIKDIDALLVDKNIIWIGNFWGLSSLVNGNVESFDVEGKQVRSLAVAPGGSLWLGTNWGLYRFAVSEKSLNRQDTWPRDEVLSLVVEPDTGYLWVLTVREIGRLVDNVWQAIPNLPPMRFNKLLAVSDTKISWTEGQVLVAGANGVHQIAVDKIEAIFYASSEDTLSNSIRCLWADTSGVWVGAVQGLYFFDSKIWKSYAADAPNLRDIYAILPETQEGRLWVGSFRMGLQRLQQGVYIPEQLLHEPIVSLASGADGSLWAATFDTLFYRSHESHEWQLVNQSALHLSGAIIQTICYQLAREESGEAVDILWVGTSSGLFYYRPSLDLGDWVQDFAFFKQEQVSIQTMAIDPKTNCLWVGTSIGLFSEHKWLRHREADIQALAFDAAETFWLGTAAGLEQWPSPGEGEWFAGKPTAIFTTANSGLAANMVTALSVGVCQEEFLLWIGSNQGISCYSYTPGKV